MEVISLITRMSLSNVHESKHFFYSSSSGESTKSTSAHARARACVCVCSFTHMQQAFDDTVIRCASDTDLHTLRDYVHFPSN